MTDKNGNLVTVGARVRFAAKANSDFREGWPDPTIVSAPERA